MQLRIDRARGRKAYAGNEGSLIAVEISEGSRVEIQAKPFKWHVPNAIRVNFVAFRHGHVE